MGIPMSIGTGAFKLLHKYPFFSLTAASSFDFFNIAITIVPIGILSEMSPCPLAVF